MSGSGIRFVDRSGAPAARPELWPPIVIPREEIDAEVERLASLLAPANGRRCSLIVHPCAKGGNGLAPGIQMALEVLGPGERTRPIRHNSSVVNFCIRGRGRSIVGGRQIDFAQYDVWNTPALNTYQHFNEVGSGVQVRLSYSNAALLEQMNVHIVDEEPPMEEAGGAAPPPRADPRRTNPFGTFELAGSGAFLMPYERLINPEMVESRPLHWPWKTVKQHLDELQSLGSSYAGRRLYLLYNPATGRTNGTTHSLFATMTVRPPRIVDRPHRHAAAAINYYFSGRGRSTVEGRVLEWKAGDLMLSAPGWAVHNHASYDEPVYELTVQDSPLNIAMDSLLWQEDLSRRPRLLGSQHGFETNRKGAA